MRGDRLGVPAAIAGLVAAAAVFVAVAVVGGAAWRAWLGAAVLLTCVPTGALATTMMLRLIPGAWRDGLAEQLAAAPALLAPAALAMAPILAAPGLLYAWVGDPGPGAFRAAWMTPGFFALRGVLWFVLLVVLAVRLGRDPRAERTATLGLIAVVVFGLPIAFDWLLSLDHGFASSGFGLYLLSVAILLALALAVAAGARHPEPRVRDVLGGSLFTVAILWAYLGFMQYFITWSGDLPGGVHWYLRRGDGWGALAWLAIGLKTLGIAPLIFGHVRRSPKYLALCALLIAAASVPEIGWLALPAPGAPAGWGTLGLFLAASAALGLCGFGLVRIAGLRRRGALGRRAPA
jgi:hypothetical protein